MCVIMILFENLKKYKKIFSDFALTFLPILGGCALIVEGYRFLYEDEYKWIESGFLSLFIIISVAIYSIIRIFIKTLCKGG